MFGTVLAAGLAVGLAVAVLAGCGSEGGAAGGADGVPAGGSAPISRTGTAGELDHTLVAILSATAAGGTVDNLATVLDADTAVADFTEQFDGHTLATQVGRAANRADTPPGQVLIGAVISIDCDVPPGVTLTSTEVGVEIAAEKVLEPLQECYAPVTTVALVHVDADAV